MTPLILGFLLGCSRSDGQVVKGAPGGEDPDEHAIDEDTDPEQEDSSTGGDSAAEGPCPSGMVVVDGAFCIDATEATLEEQGADGGWSAASPYETVGGRAVRAVSRPGQVPQGYISGDEAADACAAAGKRLCTTDEWLLACQGPDGWTWPYGDTYDADACNDTYEGGHPVVDYFDSSDVWDSEHMNDPGINQQPNTVEPGGANAGCVSFWGAYDLHGNLHEWVDDPDGTFRGGFYADAEINGPGCTYRTTAHTTSYHDYSTGFRCCADL